MSYENCIFDLYGTLVDIRTDEEKEQLWQGLIAEFGSLLVPDSAEGLKREYHRLVREKTEHLALHYDGEGEIDLGEVFEGLLRQGERSEEVVAGLAHRFRTLSTEHICLYPGADGMLAALRAAGKKLWLLSNAQRLFTEPELDRLGISEAFDGIYLSSDHGCRKPDPAFFQCLLREHAIDPGTAIMVGNDGTCDIAGARAVGLATCYISSNQSPVGDEPEADRSLKSPDMEQLLAVLLQ